MGEVEGREREERERERERERGEASFQQYCLNSKRDSCYLVFNLFSFAYLCIYYYYYYYY